MIKNIEEKAQWIKNHIRNNEWISDNDGNSWFNGYYDNHGSRVEGEFNNNIRMMLTGQVFTIMSNTASNSQVEEIVKSADKYLYDKTVGGYKLNTDFNELKTDLGRMFGFAYGHKENGAVFSHMAIMYANALYKRGFVKEGFKVIDTLYKHCSDFEMSRIYPGIPEYINSKGRGMYHYLTGAASWLILTVLTEMFGVKGKMGDLFFEPKLMLNQFDDENKAVIKMTFADRRFNIEYINNDLKECNEYKISEIIIDDRNYEFEKLPMIKRSNIESLEKEKVHNIKIILE